MCMCKAFFMADEYIYCMCVPPCMACRCRFVGYVVMCPAASLPSVHWLQSVFPTHPKIPAPLSASFLTSLQVCHLICVSPPYISSINIQVIFKYRYVHPLSFSHLLNKATGLHDHCSCRHSGTLLRFEST